MYLFLVLMYLVFHQFFYDLHRWSFKQILRMRGFCLRHLSIWKEYPSVKKIWSDFIGTSFIKAQIELFSRGEIELFSRGCKGHKRCNYCNPSWYRLNLHWLVWTFRWTPWTFSLQLCKWYYSFVDCTAERISFSPALLKLNTVSVIEGNFLNFRCTNWL